MKTTAKIIFFVTGFAMLVGLTACKGSPGGKGSTSTGGDSYNHEELAREFVRRVNSDLSKIDLKLVKTYTLQYNYIVAFDDHKNTYNAYYIGDYNVGESLDDYFDKYENRFYYGLYLDTDSVTYYDFISGTRFETQEMSPKNLAKIQAFKEQILVRQMAEKLNVDYGLSAEKSMDVARFAYKVQNSPKGSYKASDYDAFVKEMTGSSITEFQNDAKDGNNESLKQRLEVAEETTGMSSEGVNKLMSTLFSE